MSFDLHDHTQFEEHLEHVCRDHHWPVAGAKLPACALVIELARHDPGHWGAPKPCRRCEHYSACTYLRRNHPPDTD